MTQCSIDSVRLGNTRSSWLGSAEAALRAPGWFAGDTTDLMGQTGFAFHFHINPGVCPSSATDFPWTDLPVYALDLLGVDNEAFQVTQGLLNEPAMRARAVERIRNSIDRGVPALIWAPTRVLEFGVVNGYDDEDQVFDVLAYGPPGAKADPLLYDNLGRGEVPILFYQLLYSRREVDPVESQRRALELAVQLWKPTDNHPGRGKAGYPVLLEALRREDFVPFGLAYTMAVYSDAKRHAHDYLERLVRSQALPDLEPARDAYAQAADALPRVSELLPFHGPASKVDSRVLPEVISLVARGAEQEDTARRAIAQALAG